MVMSTKYFQIKIYQNSILGGFWHQNGWLIGVFGGSVGVLTKKMGYFCFKMGGHYRFICTTLTHTFQLSAR